MNILIQDILMQLTTSESQFPYAAIITLAVGFLAATFIGTIAWYNSKRPVGWENKERPDIVPNIDK